MSEKNAENPTYEGIIRRTMAAEGRIRYVDQQINSLKGMQNFFKRRGLKKKRVEDLEYIKKLMEQTPSSSVGDTVEDASRMISRQTSTKDPSE